MGRAEVAGMTTSRLPRAISSRYPELVFALLVLFVSFGAVGFAARAGWPGAPNHCVLDGDCYCEAARPGPVAQPANTWSLLPFSLAGLGLALHSGRARQRRVVSPANRMSGTSFYPALYCGIVTFMGPGGAFFHASLTDWGGAVDVLSMFLWINFLIVYDLTSIYRWRRLRFLAVYLGSTAVFMLPRVLYGPAGVPLFAVAFGFWLLIELVIALPGRMPSIRRPGYRDRYWLLAYATVSVAALGIWAASHGGGPLCKPDSLVQGHAVWHVLNAIAFVLLYRYLRSERSNNDAAQQEGEVIRRPTE